MKRLVVAMTLALVWAGSARAEDAPAFKLELKDAPDLPSGKVATVQGTAKPAGDKFFVDSVGVMQPVVITLIAQNKGDAIKIVLGKQRWDEDLKEATTGPDGQVTLKLRTQGEVRMTVSAADKKKYWLVVWVGAEVLPQLAPAVLRGGAAATSSKTSPVVAGLVIALVVLALAFVVRMRRRGGKQ